MLQVSSHRIAAMAAVVFVTLAPASAWGQFLPPERLIIFGDSLSDTGNTDILTFGIVPGRPYVDGRFSDGPVWIESLAAEFLLGPVVPSRAGGTNYAHGGAETGPGFSSVFIPNMGEQVDSYMSGGPNALPDDLFVLLGGANNFLNGETNPQVPANDLADHVSDLTLLGADQFLALSLPPLGKTPRFRGTPDETIMDTRTMQFNTAYAAELDALEVTFGITILRFDLFEVMQAILADPGSFGFLNVTEPAYDEGSGQIVPNPEEYLFWDDIHPTTAAHTLLGQWVASRLFCPADIGFDGSVGIQDLLTLLADWGRSGFALPSDVDGSGAVGITDLLMLLAAWGVCP